MGILMFYMDGKLCYMRKYHKKITRDKYINFFIKNISNLSNKHKFYYEIKKIQ